jgi:hypothetical protein
MIPNRSTTKSGGNKKWPESGRSGPWYRSRTDGQFVSSLSERIPSIIPKSTRSGVSKCSPTRASGVSGSRMEAAAPRLHPNIGCSPTTSKSLAMAAHPSIQQTANAFAARTIPARPCKPERADMDCEGGGRGFISSKGGSQQPHLPSCAEFFSWGQSFELFSGNQRIQTTTLQFAQAIQCSPTIRGGSFVHLFSEWSQRVAHPPEKTSRNSRGGGYLMTAFIERTG